MTALQLLMVAGMLVMAGVATFVWWASPAQPDLADALDRISPHSTPIAARVSIAPDATEQAGLWGMRWLPASWVRVPVADLAVLRKSVAAFYGEKLAFAGIAALAVPLLSWLVSWTVPMTITIPVVITLACMVAGWSRSHALWTLSSRNSWKARSEMLIGMLSTLLLQDISRSR